MATARGNGSGIHVRTFGSLLGMIVALLALFNTVRNSNAANGCRFQGDKCGPGLKPCCPVLRCVDLDENGFGTCTQPRNGPDDDDDETDNTSGIPVTTVAVNVTSPTTRGPAMCTSSGQKCGPAIYAPCCSGLQCENVKASDDYGVCHRRVGGFDLTDSDSSCNFKYSTCFPCATQETAPNALYVEKRLLWPNKTVPYKFYSDDFDKWEILKIHQAMDAIQELTAGCVRFAERKKVKPEKDFVTFGKDEQCSAQLGRVGGRQDITFTSECLKDRGSVQRYLLRTLGLPYEHTRLDRDKYIVVNSDNILPDHRSEFEKHAGPTFGLPYDYLSVLHCGINEYAIDKLFPTVVPLLSRTPLGKSSNLSPSDVAKLSQLYSCNNS